MGTLKQSDTTETMIAPSWWIEIGLPAQDFERFTQDLDDARHEGERRLRLLRLLG